MRTQQQPAHGIAEHRRSRGVAVVDAQELHRGSRDHLQRVLRAAVAQEVGTLGAEQQLEQRILQLAVLQLEMRKRLRVHERDQQQSVAVCRPQRPVDVDEAVDRIRLPIVKRAARVRSRRRCTRSLLPALGEALVSLGFTAKSYMSVCYRTALSALDCV